MIIRHIPNFAPDGSTGKGRDFFAAVAAAAAGNGATRAEAGNEVRRRRATDQEQYHHNHDGYDDGLVHSHHWAASDR